MFPGCTRSGKRVTRLEYWITMDSDSGKIGVTEGTTKSLVLRSTITSRNPHTTKETGPTDVPEGVRDGVSWDSFYVRELWGIFCVWVKRSDKNERKIGLCPSSY